MNDNPFSEPGDTDRTILRVPGRGGPGATPGSGAGSGIGAGPGATMPPAAAWPAPSPLPPSTPSGPGATTTTTAMPAASAAFPMSAPAPAEPAAASLAGVAEVVAVPAVGRCAMTAAAAPLLDLLRRIATMADPRACPDVLRQAAVDALEAFTRDCRAAGIPDEQVRAGHYALCAALDDAALATPWGRDSIWRDRSLAVTFHRDTQSGERFFAMLDGLQREPERFRQALELCWLCLALGMRGRYRLDARGAPELERRREELHALLMRMSGRPEASLSPQWRGVDAPHRPPSRDMPAWVPVVSVLALLALGWLLLAMQAHRRGDALQAQMASLPPAALPVIERQAAARPVRQPVADDEALGRLRRFLAPEIERRLVSVQGDAQTLLVRVLSRGMFDSGSDQLRPDGDAVLQRIGQALGEEPGDVRVVGHSDNQPIRSVRFPSNYDLSAARAEAARRVLAQASGQPARFRAEGRAEREPLESNDTPAGREANRRVDIVLTRQGH